MHAAIAQPGTGVNSGPAPAPPAPAPAQARAVAGGLDRLPPTLLLLLAVVSVQLGGALASVLFSSLSPIGITFASSAFTALVLSLFGRRRGMGWGIARGSGALLRRHAGLILGFGAVNLALSLGYYLALERLPLGIVATVTFLGPLGLAVATSRRLVHFVCIAVALAGVLLLTPEIGGAAVEGGLDPIGLVEAAIAGIAWAAFVPLSQRTGTVFPGTEGLAWAFWVATAAMLPVALIEGSVLRTDAVGLAGAFAVSLLGVVVPLALEFRALQRMSARTYGILVTLEPAIGAGVGMLFLAQPAGPRMVVAIACVTLAALGVTLSDRKDAGE